LGEKEKQRQWKNIIGLILIEKKLIKKQAGAKLGSALAWLILN
jgi:hypothetical protein